MWQHGSLETQVIPARDSEIVKEHRHIERHRAFGTGPHQSHGTCPCTGRRHGCDQATWGRQRVKLHVPGPGLFNQSASGWVDDADSEKRNLDSDSVCKPRSKSEPDSVNKPRSTIHDALHATPLSFSLEAAYCAGNARSNAIGDLRSGSSCCTGAQARRQVAQQEQQAGRVLVQPLFHRLGHGPQSSNMQRGFSN